MKTNLIITDDFYNNPEETREWALKQPFNVAGNFPGRRTKPVHDWDLEKVIQGIVKPHGGKITYFTDEYCTAFQYTVKDDESWIHADHTTMWAGVCYLTPNAPADSGTGIFRHKKTGWETAQRNKDGSYDQSGLDIINADARDYSKWDMTAMVGNVFNRLVLYRGDMFHRSLEYFGKDKHDGRLFQTFFFNTEF
jgi:hypothetical protein